MIGNAKERFSQIDWTILLPVIFLLIFGISAVYSSSAAFADAKFGSSEFFFRNHIRNVLIAFVFMIVTSFVNYRFWAKSIKVFMWITLVLLIIVLLFGTSTKGANRWIELGVVNFQPSELVKLVLIVYIAKILEERDSLVWDFRFVAFPIFFWTSIFLVLIALQPNFSTSVVIFFAIISILLISKLPKRFVLRFTIFSLLVTALFAISAEYRMSRLTAFWQAIKGEKNTEIAYQMNQALIAFGNGGFWGLGPGHSRQSQLFLPESYGDFVFSIIGEEYGFIGTFFISVLFGYMLVRIYKTSKLCRDNFSFFITVGTFFVFAYFFLVNTAVNLGLLPTTGLPMPFISYGGTALIIYSILIGIVLNISKQNKKYQQG